MNKQFKTIMRLLSVILTFCTIVPLVPVIPFVLPVSADQTEEPRKTPIMGWASWNAYRTDISEETILSQANKLVELGLADLGYIFVNIDDGWQNGRGDDGYVKTNTIRFPSGMKNLADTIHSMGLKAGIYTDAGDSTCGWESDNEHNNYNVGLFGHDEDDLKRYFIDWGYDFIKVDWCGGRRLGLSQEDRYTTIGKIVADIEAQTGVDKIYNVCCWGFPGEWVVDYADSWRTGGDITNNFDSILYQIDNIKSLAKYNGPGHVNDLDMMQVGNGMSYEEDKSHFAMWCMMSTPLMLGMDLNSISEETLSIISNKELIAVNQDPACIQATVKKTYGSVEAWTKDLGSADSGKKAIALLNRENKEQTLTISFSELGLDGVSVVRDLWAHTDIATGNYFTVTIPAHGTVVMTAEGTPIADEIDQDIFVEDGSNAATSIEIASKPGTINLTELGKYDWVHYGNQTTTTMRDGAGEIKLTHNGSYLTYGNAAATYTWRNGSGSSKIGSSTSGIGVKDVGSSLTISTPCDANERTLYVTVGSYSADIRIEFIVGGKVISSEEIKGGDRQKVDKLVTMTYSSDIPTTAHLRWTVIKKLGSDESVNVEGVALDMAVKTNTLSKPTLSIGAQGMSDLSAIVNFTVTENAKLHIVTKDLEGKLTSVITKSVEASSEPFKEKVALDLPTGFAGKLYAYLWSETNLPLVPAWDLDINTASSSEYNVGPMTAKKLIKDGAILLDVRTPEEFEKNHLEGALNLDYTKIATEIESVVSDKNQLIVVYCSAAKRSAQAVDTLLRLGYKAVFNLGSYDNYYSEPAITFTTDTCKVITAGERVKVSFTSSLYDCPEVYVSAGKNSTLEDAVPLKDFAVPNSTHYYLTLKAYLVQDGVCHAETEKEFIFWSEDTVDTFATDIEWIEATIGWGTIHKNQSVEGNKLKLAGKNFAHGIGTHATSNIVMNIPEGAKKFLAVAGCDLEKSGGETMMFYVYIDGIEVDQSSLIKIGQHYVFDIDIPEGAKEIRLFAYEGTFGGNTNDHADWAVAGFFNDITEG